MIDRVKDYIGWWMLIPAFVIILLQVPGCVEKQNVAHLKHTEVMTAHCASKGKTYLEYPSDSTGGQCI